LEAGGRSSITGLLGFGRLSYISVIADCEDERVSADRWLHALVVVR
jgi:hypothetical protein